MQCSVTQLVTVCIVWIIFRRVSAGTSDACWPPRWDLWVASPDFQRKITSKTGDIDRADHTITAGGQSDCQCQWTHPSEPAGKTSSLRTILQRKIPWQGREQSGRPQPTLTQIIDCPQWDEDSIVSVWPQDTFISSKHLRKVSYNILLTNLFHLYWDWDLSSKVTICAGLMDLIARL